MTDHIEEYLLPGEGILIDELPKVSLHDHLDGGLRPGTIVELARAIDAELPADEPAALGEWFRSTPDPARSPTTSPVSR